MPELSKVCLSCSANFDREVRHTEKEYEVVHRLFERTGAMTLPLSDWKRIRDSLESYGPQDLVDKVSEFLKSIA